MDKLQKVFYYIAENVASSVPIAANQQSIGTNAAFVMAKETNLWAASLLMLPERYLLFSA